MFPASLTAEIVACILLRLKFSAKTKELFVTHDIIDKNETDVHSQTVVNSILSNPILCERFFSNSLCNGYDRFSFQLTVRTAQYFLRKHQEASPSTDFLATAWQKTNKRNHSLSRVIYQPG